MRFRLSVAMALTALSVSCAKEAAKPAAPPPPKVLVAAAQTRAVDLFTENVGQLDGYVNADIRARVRGYLKEQLYRDGAQVKAGQLLFTIDPVEWHAALDQARGTLARARAQVQLAKQQFDRSQALIKTGTVTQKSVDDATGNLEDAQGQERAAQAQVATAELNVSYTQIRSPIDGIAGLAQVRVGNLVGQDGPTRLTTVSTVDPMRVRFPISERDYLRNAKAYQELATADVKQLKERLLSLDQAPAQDNKSVELVLADDSTYARRGLIVATDREVNPNTGTIQVEALFANPDGILRPGQYARLRLRRSDSLTDSVVVPQKALVETQGTYSVAVVKQDNKVELRRVEVGPVTGEDRVITKGLTKGERIVVEGVQKATDGAPVVPEQAPENTGVKAAAATP